MYRVIVIAILAPACMFSAISQRRSAARRATAAWRFARTAACRSKARRRRMAWRVWYMDSTGERELYVAAAAVNELPDTQALESYAADVARRYPEAKRIPMRDINFASLVEQPRAYRGYYLVIRQAANGLTNEEAGGGSFRFTIPIPIKTGSRWLALAQFELANATFAGAYKKGEIGYRCGGKFCDDLVIVAELTGRTVDRVDELGTVRRLPVFAVRELGDRYGTSKPE